MDRPLKAIIRTLAVILRDWEPLECFDLGAT